MGLIYRGLDMLGNTPPGLAIVGDYGILCYYRAVLNIDPRRITDLRYLPVNAYIAVSAGSLPRLYLSATYPPSTVSPVV